MFGPFVTVFTFDRIVLNELQSFSCLFDVFFGDVYAGVSAFEFCGGYGGCSRSAERVEDEVAGV